MTFNKSFSVLIFRASNVLRFEFRIKRRRKIRKAEEGWSRHFVCGILNFHLFDFSAIYLFVRAFKNFSGSLFPFKVSNSGFFFFLFFPLSKRGKSSTPLGWIALLADELLIFSREVKFEFSLSSSRAHELLGIQLRLRASYSKMVHQR